MVYFSGETTTEEQSTPTSDGTEITTIEAAQRVSDLFSPFVQLVTVIVQALTAYTLLKQI